jgi:hypothetical protein
VPLKDVPPGIYVLRVEARSRLAGNDKPVGRDVLIQIWPAPQPAAQPSAQAAPAATAPPEQASSVVPVVRGPRSAVEDHREVVARSAEEWQALWAMLPLKQAAPQVNFANTMVAAVFVGPRPTSGYSVEIVRTRLDGETLVIEYAERKPSPEAMTAQVMTSPYAVAGVPMHAGPVRFEQVAAGQ